jgi:hypothetical protein
MKVIQLQTLPRGEIGALRRMRVNLAAPMALQDLVVSENFGAGRIVVPYLRRHGYETDVIIVQEPNGPAEHSEAMEED